MSFTLLAGAVDSVLARKSFSAHDFFVDVEAYDAANPRASADAAMFGLVIRSRDKTVIGKTNTPADAELCFSDNAGRSVPFIVAEAPAAPDGSAPAVLADAAAQLIAFYTADTAFSVRYAALGDCARAVLPIALAVFGAKSRKRNGWKVGSLHASNTKAAEKRNAEIAEAAKVLNNADALAAALASISGNGPTAGAPLSPELLALVKNVWSMVGAAATPAAAPVASPVLDAPVAA